MKVLSIKIAKTEHRNQLFYLVGFMTQKLINRIVIIYYLTKLLRKNVLKNQFLPLSSDILLMI